MANMPHAIISVPVILLIHLRRSLVMPFLIRRNMLTRAPHHRVDPANTPATSVEALEISRTFVPIPIVVNIAVKASIVSGLVRVMKKVETKSRAYPDVVGILVSILALEKDILSPR